LIHKDEHQIKQLEKEIDAVKKLNFHLTQNVHATKRKKEDTLAEIQGLKAFAKNLQLRIQELDAETQKQLEKLYNSNFQIQWMQRKIYIEGNCAKDESNDLQAQINSL
jgi:chromosome segregation ATPase